MTPITDSVATQQADLDNHDTPRYTCRIDINNNYK